MKREEKFKKKINYNCCNHRNLHEGQYQIGYVGFKFCKVAICLDCGERQIICGRIGEFFLRRFLRKGIRKVYILGTITIKNKKIFD